jgi:hypothetical protein
LVAFFQRMGVNGEPNEPTTTLLRAEGLFRPGQDRSGDPEEASTVDSHLFNPVAEPNDRRSDPDPEIIPERIVGVRDAGDRQRPEKRVLLRGESWHEPSSDRASFGTEADDVGSGSVESTV